MRAKAPSNFTVDLNKILEATDDIAIDGKNITFNMRYWRRIEKMDVSALEIPLRDFNTLRRNRINKIWQVVDKWEDLGKLRAMGAKGVKAVKNGVIALYYDSLTTEEKVVFWKDALGR